MGKSDVVPTISLAFTLADEYYPHQEYKVHRAQQRIRVARSSRLRRLHFKVPNKRSRVGTRRPFIDEDSVTAAVEAGKLALIHSGVDSSLVGKVYVGSESNPYAVKPIASKVAQVLKLGEEDGDVQGVDAVDTEFACKAATSMFKDACCPCQLPAFRHKIRYGLSAQTTLKQRQEAAQAANWTRLSATAAPRSFSGNTM